MGHLEPKGRIKQHGKIRKIRRIRNGLIRRIRNGYIGLNLMINDDKIVWVATYLWCIGMVI